MSNEEFNLNHFLSPLSPMRFQAQLGKEIKRRNKEGENVVKLSLARVVKVNYKYNTVDVVTTLHKNAITKNPVNNGKFSARLPVSFGGRTPDGNVYGTNTLVTIGSLVLVGFLEGQKDTPIVLNIYGDVDNQSKLTRTTYASADESDESIQQELWNLFTLYPSMTYKSVDGNGNQEITFSGKSFMIMSDADPGNEYIQDGEFDYQDLPNSKYADGQLIEPKSPNSPTLLYVHQGIYDKHRVTFFIKSDGTVRLGSRHVDGEGITFMEMTTDGAFRIRQQAESTNPEIETEKFSQMGIDEEGRILFTSPKNELEVSDAGVLVNGKPMSAIIGGGDSSIGDLIDELEKVKTEITIIDGKFQTVITKEEYDVDLENLKKYSDELFAGTKQELDDISKAIDDLDNYIDGAFEDGIIEASESQVIRTYLNTLRTEKADMDAKFEELVGNDYLPEVMRTSLTDTKTAYDTWLLSLITTIEDVILDGKASLEERTRVDDAFATYRTALASLAIALQKAVDAIALAYAKDAEWNSKKYTESSFTQLADMISSKVESEEFNKKVDDIQQEIAEVESNLSQDIIDKIGGIEQQITYKAEIVSTNGVIFQNGVIDTTLFARVYQGTTNVTDSLAASQFKWTRISDDAASDTTWNNAHATGSKSISITPADLNRRATFSCEIKKDNVVVAISQITIYDANDVISSPTEPANPREGVIWMDISAEPYKFYVYKNGKFEPTGPINLAQLDPDAAGKVEGAYSGVINLDDATKLTRYERSVVRGELANITGVFLAPTATMPTLAELDAGGQGQVYATRKSARDVGISTSSTVYVDFGNAYTALRTYLSGLTPKAWDISSTATNSLNQTNWDTAWSTYRLKHHLLNVLIQQRQVEYADAIGQQSVTDAIKAVSGSNKYETKAITNPMTISSPIASVALPEFQGRHVDIGTAHEDKTKNRYQPITAPEFSSGATLVIGTTFYGDGTVNDSFSWSTLGVATKTRHWENTMLGSLQEWQFFADRTGYKVVSVPFFADSVTDNTVIGATHNRTALTRMTSISGANQVTLAAADRTLYISIADSVSGWGESYTPSADEIKAYFNGYKMCNGTFNTAYNGTGNKVWYPIGDTNLNRSTIREGGAFDPVPTDESLALKEGTINKYQILFRLGTPVNEVVTFDGILPLIEGDNTITITYPDDTPAIQTGHIRYALNLATVTDALKYIIPTMQIRLKKAEEVITDDSIVNTVMNSVSYQLSMKDKANLADLEDYAKSEDIDERIKNGLDSLDFSPYVTQSQLNQTALDITAKFSATGGMNLLRNSIGFAGLDFWTKEPSAGGTVTTIGDEELSMLGFGSGFLFNPDGTDKGLKQTAKVIPGQPYTLSWYLNKRTAGAGSSDRFLIQIRENGSIVKQIADNSSTTTVGYKANYFTHTPQSEEVEIVVIGSSNVSATLTGLMFTIGDVALQWSLATGELYNTNVRMDINGIRVSQLDAEKREVGYTQITPDEFAGYARDEFGAFQKVFYLSGDETVTKKLRANEEISMGNVKAININSGGYNGWAFISTYDQ